MDGQGFDPVKVTQPMQLAAAWFATLVVLEGVLFASAREIGHPGWASGSIVACALALIPVWAIAVFLLQTVFRSQLQTDEYYAKDRERAFRGFRPDDIQAHDHNGAELGSTTQITKGPDADRIRRYTETRGLFLVHRWRVSAAGGSQKDVVVRLWQHRQGPLTFGTVERVEYQLGPKFANETVVVNEPRDGFRLDLQAYGPLLCLARVFFKDGSKPLDLERYIDLKW